MCIDGSHLKTDVSTSDDKQLAGYIRQLQRPGRVHHSLRADLKILGHRWDTARGKHAVVERQLATLRDARIGALEDERCGVLESTPCADDLHVATLGQLCQSPC